MAKHYHPQLIEAKWLQVWEKTKPPQAVDFARRDQFYALVEFPYPSGEGLHLGHAFTMTMADVFARKKRLEGKNVLFPMGWDAFGLPTENYAVRTGIHPALATQKNTNHFRRQMKQLGLAFNWQREVNTTAPDYYHWTQWIFLQLFKHGLAYKAKMPVGWCPSCKIILANEEIVDGKCERCGAAAERRQQEQWLLRITAYADCLDKELDLVDFPDYVKQAQRHWIGRSEGIDIKYPVVGQDLSLACYTTRPDTNFGASFIVIAPEHPLVARLTTTAQKNAVSNYIKLSKRKSELERTDLSKEKTGVFSGSFAKNRLTGKKMPIWVGDFVVLSAGTGVVVGVPAHDERDFVFAQKYKLPILPVVKSVGKQTWDFKKAPFCDLEKAVVFNSQFLDGLPPNQAKEKIITYLLKKGWGKSAVNYHLRDWIFSRQHYWGEPIPMIYCPACAQKGLNFWQTKEGKQFKPLFAKFTQNIPGLSGWFPVKEKELPVKLPEIEKYQPTDTGESPLVNVPSWVKTKCPQCGGPARRETDTMPNWAGSSWYFLRYCDPKNKKALADLKKLKYWLPVDVYLGGAEHTTLHLLYSRFWHKFLNDIQVAPGKEPYAARRQHGVILGEDGARMSKSRGNVIVPEVIVKKFGADTLRLYLLFMGPYDATLPWSSRGVAGVYRFLSRVWQKFQIKKWPQDSSDDLCQSLHRLIKKVGEDIDKFKFNTAIAALMSFSNQWTAKRSLNKKDAAFFVQLLSPLAPFLAEELWSEVLGNKGSVHLRPWPKYNNQLITAEKITVVVQINGKVRGQVELLSNQADNQAKVTAAAKKQANVNRCLQAKKIKKTIFVPNKLINFVV